MADLSPAEAAKLRQLLGVADLPDDRPALRQAVELLQRRAGQPAPNPQAGEKTGETEVAVEKTTATSGKTLELSSQPGTQETVAVVEETTTTTGVLLVPIDLFRSVEGHRAVKDVFWRALASPRPSHVLLDGPRGTAKSLFMTELGRMPNSHYANGGNTSAAGIIEYLLAHPECRWLIVDEIDKMRKEDHQALLDVMDPGIVSRTKSLGPGKPAAETQRRDIWIFAGSNHAEVLPVEMRDRFNIVPMPAYSRQQYEQVAQAVLEGREGLDPALAREIVKLVGERSQNPRDAVKIARLSGGQRRGLRELVKRTLAAPATEVEP